MKATQVILGVHERISSRDFLYATRLACALNELRCDASVLLTQTRGSQEHGADVPSDFRVHRILSEEGDGWAEYWLELIRFLEERAPCLYLSSPVGPAGWIYPRLSSRVLVVPLLHRDDGTSYDHCRFLGSYCNAVVPLHPVLRQRILADFSNLARRVATLPDIASELNGNVEAGTVPKATDAARACMRLAERLSDQAARGVYRRPRRRLSIPDELLPGLGGSAIVRGAALSVNRTPLWPNPADGETPARRPAGAEERPSSSLRDFRIAVGVTSGRISGVDVFTVNLVQALRGLGYRAEVLRTMASEKTADPLPLPGDVPVVDLTLPQYPTWRQRWAALKSYLEREPTIYIPNYDERHSAVVPTLAPHVRVLGIAHSDDPQHYGHIMRLAPFWDAVVAVSRTIASHLEGLAPGIEARLSVIPYGVPVADEFPGATRGDRSPLLAVFAGRIVQYQKRAFDLLRVGDAIRGRGLSIELTVAGDGSDADAFVRRAAPLFLARVMRWVGSLPNEDVVNLLSRSHVYILPSSFEGLPVSVLEAMANGCVPIATAIRSGIPELIEHGRNGFLVDVGDVAAVTAALEKLDSDEPLRRRMASAAYETVRNGYTADGMAKLYVAALEQMLARNDGRPAGRLMPPPSIWRLDVIMPVLPLFLRRMVWRIREGQRAAERLELRGA